jgi:hypothetical protein
LGESQTPAKSLGRKRTDPPAPANVKKNLVKIPLTNVRAGYAEVRPQDVELVSMFRWRYQDGLAITDLLDSHQITCTMGFMINHHAIVFGSHGMN